LQLKIQPVTGLQGQIKVPGDKSISHRSVMFGAIADGITEVSNFLMGEDCLSTIDCFRKLGVQIEVTQEKVTIHGKGLYGLTEPSDLLDVGNSGTTTRLMLGILAGLPFTSVLNGDASIRKRPMGRVTKPLMEMGARIVGREAGTKAPLAIQGGNLKAINYQSPVASAQVKSAIILAGLYTLGNTSVSEPEKSRDHTERTLKAFGADLVDEGLTVTIKGGAKLTGQQVVVPGDISSAAFFLVAGAIVPGAEVLIENVGINPTRDGVIEVLKNMGADLSILNQREVTGEPVADILVKGSQLKGTTISGSLIPRLIDEVPVLAVAAAVAQGETVISDAEELKVKESNRITAVVTELRRFGVDIEERPDGMIIRGGKPLKGGAVCESYHDHRIAMSMAIAGLVAQGETIINDSESINISFPGFVDLINNLKK
jgi:3-phosphoshikimate 1-carboxyvinyltransferase